MTILPLPEKNEISSAQTSNTEIERITKRHRISSKNVKYFNIKKFAGAEGGGDKSCYWCH